MAFMPPKKLEESIKVKCPECGAEFRTCRQCGSVVEGPYKKTRRKPLTTKDLAEIGREKIHG